MVRQQGINFLYLAAISHSLGGSGRSNALTASSVKRSGAATFCVHARYGPVDSDDSFPETSLSEPSDFPFQQEEAFRRLIDNVLTVKDPQHIPSLLTKNLELILSLSSAEGVRIVESILLDTVSKDGEETAEIISEAIDLIVTFAEDFVEQAVRIDDQNKKLLGKIIVAVSDKDNNASSREQTLDELLQREKSNFTAGFVRHLDGECERIAAAPTMTPESARLLEILRMIQTRVLEEVGSDLGEAALVLGQLIGYESPGERMAVLEAGLTVRGPDFAKELLEMTTEALDGFKRVIGGADPGLADCIEQIDGRLRRYLEQEETEFE